MSEPVDPNDQHVTRRELKLELKSFRNEVRVLLVAGILVIRFDIPQEITAAALGAVGLKALWAFLHK